MKLEYYAPLHKHPCWYITAEMPKGKRFRPGYVNSVQMSEICGIWEVSATDGYKIVLIGNMEDRLDALTAMRDALRFGVDNLAPNETIAGKEIRIVGVKGGVK